MIRNGIKSREWREHQDQAQNMTNEDQRVKKNKK